MSTTTSLSPAGLFEGAERSGLTVIPQGARTAKLIDTVTAGVPTSFEVEHDRRLVRISLVVCRLNEAEADACAKALGLVAMAGNPQLRVRREGKAGPCLVLAWEIDAERADWSSVFEYIRTVAATLATPQASGFGWEDGDR